MDEQSAQVRVASLADAEQTCFTAAGVLPGNKPQPGGELSAIRENFSVAHRRDRSCSRQQSDTLYGCDPLARFAGLVYRFQLCVELFDPLIQFGQLAISRRLKAVNSLLSSSRTSGSPRRSWPMC